MGRGAHLPSWSEGDERLIGWMQLTLAAIIAALSLIAPRPLDAQLSMLMPVPLALASYAAFTSARLRLSYRNYLPGWLLVLSIRVDTALLLSLIWSFHLEYDEPAAFSLKVPTFIYFFAFVALIPSIVVAHLLAGVIIPVDLVVLKD